ncbi:early growth response protein [Purpureocillium lavendulum]|uniref:Early growth response protein n=1 Tax=Purpureocillium lavendulum TaxID=1247861 RepID=A0AB34FTT1_9HYPO|nr:early growth response protein [Purpureocillium lavendulum]
MASFQRLVRFSVGGQVSYGDLAESTGDEHTVERLAGNPFDGLKRTGDIVKTSKLLCPLESTPLIACIGLNYKKHAQEANLTVPTYPVVFTKPADALAGPNDVIRTHPDARPMLDFEGELAIIIGKDAKNVSEEDALKYVLGYAASNDVSARNFQLPEASGGQFCYAKSFDGFAPLGHTIVPPAEDGSPLEARLTTKVNGAIKQDSNTNDMIWSVGQLISHLSRGTTLRRGTVIMTGTPSGVGFFRKEFLQDGDVVEVEIEGVGKRRRKTTKEERVCTICSRSFNKAEHLARHIRSHTKEKPYQCQVCKKVYTRQDTLLRHSKSHGVTESSWAQGAGGERRETASVSSQSPHGDVAAAEAASIMAAFASPHQPSFVSKQMESSVMTPSNTCAFTVDDRPANSATSDDQIFSAQGTATTDMSPLDECTDQRFTGLTPFTEDLTSQWSSYFAGNEFDIALLDPSLFTALPEPHQPLGLPPEPSVAASTANPKSPAPTPHMQFASPPKSLIQRKWHTFSEGPSSGYITPDVNEDRRSVDEICHRDLTERLQPRLQTGSLPSTTFLNLCIQAYFANFHPVFPIVHAPTFRPQKHNGLLVLSICSIGSLFLGSSRATSRGISMFERLHKSILASWDTCMASSAHSNLLALQASAVGQTFGLLVGRPKDLTQVEMFHGCLVAWARKLRLFDRDEFDVDVSQLKGRELESAWKEWIKCEIKRRIVLAILLHDAEISGLFHHDRLLRHSLDKIEHISSEAAFEAKSAAAWRLVMMKERAPQDLVDDAPQATFANCWSPDAGTFFTFPDVSSCFELSIMLEVIGSLACESRRTAASWSRTCTKFEDLLIGWYDKYQHTDIFKRESSNLMVLWHSTFMLLHMDMDVLECACGREGRPAVSRYSNDARMWSRSASARRCIAHATLVRRHFEDLPIGTESPVYAPMCLYRCGMAWFCYTHFGVLSRQELDVAGLDMPELRTVGVSEKDIADEMEPKDGRPAASPLFRVIDLLQRMNHWKIAHSLASTLLSLFEEEEDALF